MSNLFVKVFREKVEELMPAKFQLDGLDPAMDGYTLTLAHMSADGSYTISPTPVVSGFSGNYDDLINKPALFSGSYNDLSDLPTLFDGDYNSLTNKPNLASIAFTGDFVDLTHKPFLIELPSGATPQDGDIAVYDSNADDGNGGWVLRNEAQGELERIEELEIATFGQVFVFDSGPAAKASTVLMKTMLTQSEVEFFIGTDSVAVGRIIRFHFSRVTAPEVQTLKIKVSGDINGQPHYDMVRNQTVELLCTSQNEYIIL